MYKLIWIVKYLGSSNNSNNVQGTLNEKDQKGSKVSSVEKQVSISLFIDNENSKLLNSN